MHRKAFLLLTVNCLLITILLSGCETISKGHTYGSGSTAASSLDVASLLRFNDVPVPAGFKILDAESFAFQNDATRVALLKYLGSRNADQTVSFYKEQMPLYKWSPINIIEYERRMLNYEKESESCIVTIESHGRKSIVIIAISPKSRPMKVEK
ncbi:MAG: hypothetical protein KJ952_04060 [Candidatus Omnitrophica bacterium]|nr:hypothetical protein [Candidatus Omnitrophota bacterium]